MRLADELHVIQMYQASVPVLDIERRFNICNTTVYEILSVHGVNPDRKHKARWSSIEDAKLLYTRYNGATGQDFEGCVPNRSHGSIMNRMRLLLRGGRV